jgi:FAD/FMN-containing dehydrogenase
VALSLDRLVGEPEVDAAGGTLTVHAGMTLARVQATAAAAGFRYPVDLPARDSCQIGGNIATNAGGIAVIRHGMTRAQVLGLEAVLADGTVLDMLNTMKKNNAGYDLKHCFIGSEGTLGVVTRAVLQLGPPLGETQTLLCAFEDYPSAVAFLHRLRASGLAVEAFEVMWQDFYATACGWREARPPMPPDHYLYVLCELEAERDSVLPVVEAAMESGEVTDALVAESLAQKQELWAIREDTTEFSTRMKPINFDVSLPMDTIDDFVKELRGAIAQRWPDCGIVNFGHIGDGNLHLTIDEKACEPDDGARCAAIERLVYERVGRRRGSISAEHGIGLLKRSFLDRSVAPEALAVMSRLKRVLDPGNILNPGKVLPS